MLGESSNWGRLVPLPAAIPSSDETVSYRRSDRGPVLQPGHPFNAWADA